MLLQNQMYEYEIDSHRLKNIASDRIATFTYCEAQENILFSRKPAVYSFYMSFNSTNHSVSDKTMRLYDTSRGDYSLLRKIEGQDVGWSIIDTAFSSTGNMFAYSSWSENGKSRKCRLSLDYLWCPGDHKLAFLFPSTLVGYEVSRVATTSAFAGNCKLASLIVFSGRLSDS